MKPMARHIGKARALLAREQLVQTPPWVGVAWEAFAIPACRGVLVHMGSSVHGSSLKTIALLLALG